MMSSYGHRHWRRWLSRRAEHSLGVALALLCTVSLFTHAIEKDCRCYQFQSSKARKFGVFKSPLFPRAYPLAVSCMLYVFVADEGEIVRLKFDHFELKPVIESRCHDFVRLFLDSHRAELSPLDRPSYELCGSDLPQKDFYSSTRVLMLEFHSEITRPFQSINNVRVYAGFKGGFYFERADQYKITGTPIQGTPCDFEFASDQAQKSGKFFSPGYPQNYKPGAVCTYHFRAMDGERVRLDFDRIDLGAEENRTACLATGTDPKLDADTRDLLTVTDSDRDDAGSLLGRFASYCRYASKEQIVSPGGYLRVRFSANSDSLTGVGFAGRYGFVTRHKLQPTRPLERDSAAGQDINAGQLFKYTVEFQSKDAKQGTFSSVHYPKVYPRSSKITYKFSGEPDEMIRIKFVHFQLDGPISFSCGQDYQGDRLLIFDGFSSHISDKVVVRCGTHHNSDFWSSGRYLTMEFHSDDRQTLGERGFTGNYYFVRHSSPANGLQETPKDQSAAPDDTSAGKQQLQLAASPQSCSKETVINSVDSSSGIITTPSYPLGYQQSHCSWTFVGRSNKTERVVIEIQHLDVESKTTDVSTSLECTSKDQVTVTKYIEMQLSSGKEDPVDKPFCEVQNTRPMRVMSTRVPRLKLTFYTEKASSVRKGLKFKYSFVQDFGVIGEQKTQNKSMGCYFEFRSDRASSGDFSSPNYPHPYPEQLTCTYIFRARPLEVTRIEFTNFDTETSRKTCNPDESDYVIAEECSRPHTLSSDKSLHCGRPERGQTFSYKFQTPCLRLVFVSNDRYNSPGFLAVYYFDRPSSDLLTQYGGQSGSGYTIHSLWVSLICSVGLQRLTSI